MTEATASAPAAGYDSLAYASSLSAHVRQEVSFDAPADDVFRTLFDAGRFTEMSGAPARNSAVPGGSFSYFNGMIEGTNLEVDSPCLVVQSWRLRHWQRGCFSVVAFRLRDDAGITRLLLQQWGFPEDQNLQPMWDRMYWIPVRRFLFLSERQHPGARSVRSRADHPIRGSRTASFA